MSFMWLIMIIILFLMICVSLKALWITVRMLFNPKSIEATYIMREKIESQGLIEQLISNGFTDKKQISRELVERFSLIFNQLLGYEQAGDFVKKGISMENASLSTFFTNISERRKLNRLMKRKLKELL